VIFFHILAPLTGLLPASPDLWSENFTPDDPTDFVGDHPDLIVACTTGVLRI